MPGSFLWFFLVRFRIKKGPEPARWECGNRGAISKGRWERRETWFWFSSFSTARHFHGAPPVSCALALLPESEKELSFGFLHLPGRFGVAVRSRDPVQALDAESRSEIALFFR
jgi:hypothetical protein